MNRPLVDKLQNIEIRLGFSLQSKMTRDDIKTIRQARLFIIRVCEDANKD